MTNLRNIVIIVNVILLSTFYIALAQNYKVAIVVLGDLDSPDNILVENDDQNVSMMLKEGNVLTLNEHAKFHVPYDIYENIL